MIPHIFVPVISLLFYRINVLWLYYRIPGGGVTGHLDLYDLYEFDKCCKGLYTSYYL